MEDINIHIKHSAERLLMSTFIPKILQPTNMKAGIFNGIDLLLFRSNYR